MGQAEYDAMTSQPNPDNINEYMQVLNEHRYNCEAEGKYVEAEMAQKRLNELKQQFYEQKLQELIFNQTQQKEECE